MAYKYKGVNCPMYTVTCFYKIDGPVSKVQYGAVAKQLSEYLVQHSLRGMYIYICREGGTVNHMSDVMTKNAEVYRSLYGRFVY